MSTSASSSVSSAVGRDPADVDDVDDLSSAGGGGSKTSAAGSQKSEFSAAGSEPPPEGSYHNEEEGGLNEDVVVILPCLKSTPLPNFDDSAHDDLADEEEDVWSNYVIARISMLELAGAVAAVLLQNKKGTQSGSAHGSLDRSAKKKVLEHWTMIEQPLGYITRMSGIHSKVGSPCLLHSLKLEFASGQVIEVQGEQDGWKGQAFVVEDLADNFYVSALVFDKGVCIGYQGYTTHVPLSEMMADESVADPDQLDELMADSDDEDDNFDNDNDVLNKENKIDPKNPPEDDENPTDLSGWVDSPLPAKVVPRPKKKDEYMIAHVCLCGNHGAVQGVIFHYYNGERKGELRHARKAADIYDGSIIEDAQGGLFVEIEQPDGIITRISGHRLIMSNDRAYENYLIHSLKLHFASGQVVELHGSGCDGNEEHEEGLKEAEVQMDPFGAQYQKGKYFEYDIPGDFLVTQLLFGSGKLSGVVGIKLEDHPDASDLTPPPVQHQKRPKKGCCG